MTPVTLAGLVLRPAPPALLAPPLWLALGAMRRLHPDVFTRLAELGEALFVIDPVDLPIVFLLRPGGPSPSLVAARNYDRDAAKAVIRGPLLTLIDLLEGRLDGDALFFSRELMIEGDTEAVVLMRNAVDADEINIFDDLLSVIGPLAGPVRIAAAAANGILSRLGRDLESLRAQAERR